MALDDGAPLHWRTLGQGPQNALALHCSLGHGGAWRNLLPALGDQLTIKAPDMPGHGRSPAYDGVSCTGELMLSAVLQKITAPVHVIGHSFGALSGLRLAQARPDLVRSLTLYEPVLYAASRSRAPEVFHSDVARFAAVQRLVDHGDPEAAARHFIGDWGDGRAWESLSESTRAGFVAGIAFISGSDNYVVKDAPDLVGHLPQISVPTTVIYGAQSPAIMHEVCQEISERIPRAHLVRIDDAGHMGAISHPEVMVREIKRVIDLSQ